MQYRLDEKDEARTFACVWGCGAVGLWGCGAVGLWGCGAVGWGLWGWCAGAVAGLAGLRGWGWRGWRGWRLAGGGAGGLAGLARGGTILRCPAALCHEGGVAYAVACFTALAIDSAY
ncbi:hypothetical protein DR64_3422 [Paraburkholderia xenovorans LB400]|nr:hypothetical protein DR64_3422 [Paraburkholderia xenovorans LB400]